MLPEHVTSGFLKNAGVVSCVTRAVFCVQLIVLATFNGRCERSNSEMLNVRKPSL